MQVYIVNLGKYNEGEGVGAWFAPPICHEDVAEKLGLNAEYEEYAIHDYELPFQIGEFTSIDEINRLCALVEELEGTPLYDVLGELLSSGCFHNVEDLVERQDEIRHWHGCWDMSDVAYECVEEGYLGDIPERIEYYIDYEKLGRDMEINGTFIDTRHGIFEVYH